MQDNKAVVQKVKVSPHVMEAIRKWIGRGDYVVVFTNRLLQATRLSGGAGSASMGDIFMPIGPEDRSKVVIDKTRAPDGAHGTGWRHLASLVSNNVEDFEVEG